MRASMSRELARATCDGSRRSISCPVDVVTSRSELVAQLGGVVHDAAGVRVRRPDDSDTHVVTLPASGLSGRRATPRRR